MSYQHLVNMGLGAQMHPYMMGLSSPQLTQIASQQPSLSNFPMTTVTSPIRVAYQGDKISENVLSTTRGNAGIMLPSSATMSASAGAVVTSTPKLMHAGQIGGPNVGNGFLMNTNSSKASTESHAYKCRVTNTKANLSSNTSTAPSSTVSHFNVNQMRMPGYNLSPGVSTPYINNYSTPHGNKRKQNVDPNRPKRPTSAYFYFVQLEREEAAKRGERITKVAEWTKQTSVKWRSLTDAEKVQFQALAANDKARYSREMAAYTGKDANKPKRPQSAYFLWLADFRVRMRERIHEHKEILKAAGEEWRKLTMEEKAPYEHMAEGERRKYDTRMKEYQAQAIKKAKVESTNSGSPDDQPPTSVTGTSLSEQTCPLTSASHNPPTFIMAQQQASDYHRQRHFLQQQQLLQQLNSFPRAGTKGPPTREDSEHGNHSQGNDDDDDDDEDDDDDDDFDDDSNEE